MAPAKKKHRSRSIERHVKAPREHTWQVMLDLIQAGAGPYVVEGDPPPHGTGAVLHLRFGDGPVLVETVLSFEPPWRRAYEVVGDATHLDLYQATFVLRDDGPECHVAWGVVFDPEPTDEGLEFIESAVSFIGGFLDHLVATAEASSASPSSKS